ncbi:Lrp/AsnC family transcriptional regulator [Allosphingosinicella indica]|uniref:DNA-binding transcriptional regulator, Lrp family n=1 Tax=Allosphingosinicella indica TaxID=941907 RepID=A0A1X7G0F2_9SPHN|nr:Lrp/AsnC family transcriptional regulator [Allosphingosinicella indica]SMF61477.1 DNA-binding transcriptional regulator, Lrp family [Allosphingosinicella indica]
MPVGARVDDKDRLLMTLLRRDARRSVVALARDLGLSRSATQDRIAKLSASGAITGYTTIEGNAAAAQSAYLMVRFVPGKRCADVVPRLRSIPSVALAHAIAGPNDLLVRIDGESVADIERARAAIAAVPGIGEVLTHIVLERHVG